MPSRTDPDKKMLQFSVKLTPAQHAFLDTQKDKLNVPYSSDVVRELVEGFRTCFNLPAYQAEAIQKEIAARKLDWVGYLQELLARRYEVMPDSFKSKAK